MGEIQITPGETNKLVSQPGPNREFNATITGAPVFLSHNATGTIREGKRVRPGDRVTLRNLRGQSLYAKAPATNTDPATVEIDRAGFSLIFQPRAVQASVQTGDDSESAPRTDSFVARSGDGIDVSGSSTVESFTAPDRADFVQVLADTAGNSVTCDVQYGPEGGPFIGPQFSGSGQDAIATRAAVFNPEVEVTFSGNATNLDYRIYAR